MSHGSRAKQSRSQPRLKSRANERFLQSPNLEATFGGGEANVAVALANYGLSSSFVSALPDNAIGESAVRELRSFGVEASHIKRQGDRVGSYQNLRKGL